MKRFLCLLLALLLMIPAALGEHFDFSLVDYIGCLNSFAARLGYQAAWTDNSEEMGFYSLQGSLNGLDGAHALFVHGDPVLALEMVYTFAASENAAEQNLTAFETLLSTGSIACWLAGHAGDEDLQAHFAAMNEAREAELVQLTAPFLTMDETYDGQLLRQEGTYCGYPAVLTIACDTTLGLWMLRMLLTQDAELLAQY